MEYTALPHTTADANRPTHALHQFLRDRESQSRTTEAPRSRRINLDERLEDRLKFFVRNAHACICHTEPDLARTSIAPMHPHANDDFSGLSKLDRVANEIDENLAQSMRIGCDGDTLGGIDIRDDVDLLSMCSDC